MYDRPFASVRLYVKISATSCSQIYRAEQEYVHYPRAHARDASAEIPFGASLQYMMYTRAHARDARYLPKYCLMSESRYILVRTREMQVKRDPESYIAYNVHSHTCARCEQKHQRGLWIHRILPHVHAREARTTTCFVKQIRFYLYASNNIT